MTRTIQLFHVLFHHHHPTVDANINSAVEMREDRKWTWMLVPLQLQTLLTVNLGYGWEEPAGGRGLIVH